MRIPIFAYHKRPYRNSTQCSPKGCIASFGISPLYYQILAHRYTAIFVDAQFSRRTTVPQTAIDRFRERFSFSARIISTLHQQFSLNACFQMIRIRSEAVAILLNVINGLSLLIFCSTSKLQGAPTSGIPHQISTLSSFPLNGLSMFRQSPRFHMPYFRKPILSFRNYLSISVSRLKFMLALISSRLCSLRRLVLAAISRSVMLVPLNAGCCSHLHLAA